MHEKITKTSFASSSFALAVDSDFRKVFHKIEYFYVGRKIAIGGRTHFFLLSNDIEIIMEMSQVTLLNHKTLIRLNIC